MQTAVEELNGPRGRASSNARLAGRCVFIKKVLKASKGPSVGANNRPITTTAADGVLGDKYHYCFVRVCTSTISSSPAIHTW
jgi:hypothetical protein